MTNTLLRAFPVLALLAGPAFAQGGFLGVRLGAPSDAQDVPGAAIVEVLPHGPAAIAGLRSGDRVVRVDARRIADARSLAEAVASYDPGDVVELGVVRDGEDVVVPVVLGKRPDEGREGRPRHAPDDRRSLRGFVILQGPDGAIRLDDEDLAEVLEDLDLEALEELVESHGFEHGGREGLRLRLRGGEDENHGGFGADDEDGAHGWSEYDGDEHEGHGWSEYDGDEHEGHGWSDRDEDEDHGWAQRDEDACPECDAQRDRDRLRERGHGGPGWSERGRRGHGWWGGRSHRGDHRSHDLPMGPGMGMPFGPQGPGFDPRAMEEMMERMREMHESMLRDLERRMPHGMGHGAWSLGPDRPEFLPFAPEGSVFDLRVPEGARVRAHVVYPASTPEAERERLVQEARERWGDDVEVEFRGDATVVSVQVEARLDDERAPEPPSWPDQDDTEEL